MQTSAHQIPFFTKENMSFFKNLRSQKLKVSETSAKDIKKLKELFQKSNYWAKSVAGNSLFVKEDNRWQNSGWLKGYSWARIFDKKDSNKLISTLT